MDPENNTKIITDLEMLNQMSQIKEKNPKNIHLYDKAKLQISQVNVTDIVNEINESVLSIQNADSNRPVAYFRRKDNVTKHNLTADGFITFSQLQSENLQETHNLKENIMREHSYASHVNNFEFNFGVSDTQLVDLVDGAEILLNLINKESESSTTNTSILHVNNYSSRKNHAIPSTSKDIDKAGICKSIYIAKNKQNLEYNAEEIDGEMFLTQPKNTQGDGYVKNKNINHNDNLHYSNLKEIVSLTDEILNSKMALFFDENPNNVHGTSPYSSKQDSKDYCIIKNIEISEVEIAASTNILDDALKKSQTTFNEVRKDNICIDEDIMKDFEVDFVDRHKSDIKEIPIETRISDENACYVENMTTTPFSKIIMPNTSDIDSENIVVKEAVKSFDGRNLKGPHDDSEFYSHDSNNSQIHFISSKISLPTAKTRNDKDELLHFAEPSVSTKSSSQMFHSFRTASNKDIIMSKQAIDSAISVFEDILDDFNNEDIQKKREMEKTYKYINEIPRIQSNEELKSRNIDQPLDNIKYQETIKRLNRIPLNLKEMSSQNVKEFQNNRETLNNSCNVNNNKNVNHNKQEEVKRCNVIDFHDSAIQENGNFEKPLSFSLPSTSFNVNIAHNGFEGFKSAKGQAIKMSSKSLSSIKSIFKDILEDSSIKDIELIQSLNVASNSSLLVNKSSQNVSCDRKAGLVKQQFLKGLTEKNTFQSNILKNTNVITPPRELSQSEFGNIYKFSNSNDSIRDKINAESILKSSNSYFTNSCNAIMECNTELMQICDRVDEVIARDSSKIAKMQTEAMSSYMYRETKILKDRSLNEVIPAKNSTALVKSNSLSRNMFQNVNSDTVAKLNRKPLMQEDLNYTPSLLGFHRDCGKNVKIEDSTLIIEKKIYKEILCMDTKNSTHSGHFSDKHKPDHAVFKSHSNDQNGLMDYDTVQDKNNIGLLSTPIVNHLIPTSEIESFKIGSSNFISGKSLSSEEEIIKDNISICEKSYNQSLGIQSPHNFRGFVTGSGRKIHLSEKSLSTAKNIFKDELDDEHCSLNMSVMELDIKSMQPDKIPSVPEPVSLFQGFKTGTGKPIVISESSLNSVKQIFENIHKECLDVTSNKVKSSNLKVTSSKTDSKGYKKDLEVTNNTLCTGKNIIENILPIPQTNLNFQGFKTGLGKEIKTSENSLTNVKNIFHDFMLDDINEPLEGKTGLGNNMQTKKSILSDQGQEANIPPKSPELLGFKIGQSKVVQLSDKSLSTAKSIFKDKFDDNYKSQEHLDEEVHLLEKSLPISQKIMKDFLCEEISVYPTTIKFPGFKTGSGKTVSISEKSLGTVKNVFKDIFQLPVNAGCKNFTLGSSKDILTSEKSLSQEKMVFKDIPHFDEGEKIFEENIMSKSFQTETSKDVDMSEKSLSVVRNISNNLLEAHKSEVGSKGPGFKNDFGRNIFKEPFDNNYISSDNNKYVNFDSDHKNRLSPILNEHRKKMNLKNLGLHTASGTQVKISDESLSSVRNIFSDADVNIPGIADTTPILQTDLGEVNKKSCFMGFQTGNNKSIVVSKDSLHAVKNIFDDIPFKSLVEEPRYIKKIGNESMTNASSVSKRLFNENKGLSYNLKPSEGAHLNTAVELHCNKPFKSAVTDSALIQVCDEKSMIHHANENSHMDNKENNIFNKSICNIPRLNQLAFEQVEKNDQVQDFEDNLNAYLKRKILDDLNIQNPICKRRYIQNNDNYTGIKTSPRSVLKDDEWRDPTSEKKDHLICTSPILICRSILKKSKKAFKTPFTTDNLDEANSSKFTKEVTKIRTPQKYNKNQIESFQPLRNLFQLKNTERKISLKLLQSMEDNKVSKRMLDDKITRIIPENCNDFHFSKFQQDFSYLTADRREIFVSNATEVEEVFKKLPQIDAKLVPENWIKNHCKWIIWKLASYEMKFPNSLNGFSLTVKNVLEQLIYRYHRELYSMQRPALRKILECDDTPSKKVVLCVSKIIEVTVDNVSKNTASYELEVTDGWYSVIASIDTLLSTAVKNCKICVGTKLMIQGAELTNCPQGVSPLEDVSAVRLKLFGNSTRRAKWDAKLGFQRNPSPTSIRLATVSPSGGKVSKLTVFIARIYPTLYIEKLPGGGNVIRSERMELMYASRHEIEKQHKMEKLYEEIEKDLDIDAIMNECNEKDKNGGMDSSLALLTRNADSQGIQADFTAAQLALLRDHNERRKDTIQHKIQEKIQDRLALEDQSTVQRQVTRLLKVKIIDWNSSKGKNEGSNSEPLNNMTTGLISIWRPAEDLMEVLKEGQFVNITNIFPSAMRMGECQLSANRQTTFASHRYRDKLSFTPTEVARKYTDIWSANEAKFEPIFNEFDTLGLVVFIEPFSKDTPGVTRSNRQIVYLADLDLNFLAVNFWNGLAAYGYEKYLEIGKCIACSNLQYRRQPNAKVIAQAYATEQTSFSQFSNIKHLKPSMDEMILKIKRIDLKSYIKQCQLEITNKLSKKMTFQKTCYDDMKSKRFAANSEDFHLTGLDFESTLCESKNKADKPITSPLLTTRRNISRVLTPSKRIASANSVSASAEKKLKFLSLYGNPPELSPIFLNANSPKLLKGYVQPVRLDMSSKSEKCPPRSQKDIVNSLNYIPENVEVFDDELRSFSPPLSLD